MVEGSKTVRFHGTVPDLIALEQEIRDAGYTVDTLGIGGPDPMQIVDHVFTVLGGAWGPLVLAVRAYRKRHPTNDVEVEGLDDNGPED